ncbi:MAG: ABC transporter permease [Rhodothermia bacterium]|nr:ABC transporter permease [Rhodothermia bacterium]
MSRAPLMPVLEAFRMAWDALQANRLRSGLTLLGIAIGVFAIIASVTAVGVIDRYFRDTTRFLGSNVFIVQDRPSVEISTGDRRPRTNPPITYEQALEFRRRATLPLAVGISDWFGVERIRYADRRTEPNVEVWGGDEYFLAHLSYELAEGRNLTADDVHYARSVVLLGHEVAEKLFPDRSPLGKIVKIGGVSFQVVGVVARKGSAFGQSQDRFVVAPITRLFQVYGSYRTTPTGELVPRSMLISFEAPSLELRQATREEATGLLRQIRRLRPEEPDNFYIDTNESIAQAVTFFTPYLTAGGVLIGSIALLAAGIGIMNILLVSVTERTREIGIRMAVGARRRDILWQFLLEAIFICELGGAVGILLGVLGGNVMAWQFDIRPVFPWGWAIGGVLAMTAIGLLFGVYPAARAAQLDPVEALRYE